MSSESDPAVARLNQPGAQEYLEQALEISREVTATRRCLQDIPYGSHALQRLDLYLPEQSAGKRLPVLVMVHGGRWTVGDKAVMGTFASAVTGLPAILVAPTHRRAPEFKFPALAEDIAAAVAWVYGNIAEHGCDPRRIFIGGHSSGGHLAALIAVRKEFTSAHWLPGDVIKGCFPISATFNLDFPDAEPGSEAADIMDDLFADRAYAPEASPIAHVAGNDVPFYIVYGGNDFERVMESGAAMAKALRGRPCRLATRVFEGFGHFEMALEAGRPDGPWMRTVREWMLDAT